MNILFSKNYPGNLFFKYYVQCKTITVPVRKFHVYVSLYVILQSNSPLYMKSRVAMDFSGDRGRVVADPNEALGVAFEEGYNWRVSYHQMPTNLLILLGHVWLGVRKSF